MRPTLDYSRPSPRPERRAWWAAALLLAASPLFASAAVHLVYAVEWAAVGRRPNPPEHGPDNALEAVLYQAADVSMCLALLSPLGCFVACWASASSKAGPRDEKVAVTMMAASAGLWLASAYVAFRDPWGAWYFFLD